MHDLKERFQSLQKNFDLDKRATEAALSNMDRKLENAITVSDHNVESVQSHTTRLEKIVKDCEMTTKKYFSELSNKVLY